MKHSVTLLKRSNPKLLCIIININLISFDGKLGFAACKTLKYSSYNAYKIIIMRRSFC